VNGNTFAHQFPNTEINRVVDLLLQTTSKIKPTVYFDQLSTGYSNINLAEKRCMGKETEKDWDTDIPIHLFAIVLLTFNSNPTER